MKSEIKMPLLKIEERRKGAVKFVKKWQGRGREDEDYTNFWCDLLDMVYGVEKPWDFFTKQEKVVVEGHHKKMDIYVKLSKVVIEQKSFGVDLNKKRKQSDGECLTAMEQARRYYSRLNKPERGDFIVACNFDEFQIEDQYHMERGIISFHLEDLPDRVGDLEFLIKPAKAQNGEEDRVDEESISRTASDFVRTLYSKMLNAITNNGKRKETPNELHALNVFCVRLVFCLYADDDGIFDDGQFRKFLEKYKWEDLREKFDQLFRRLDIEDKQSIEGTTDKEILDFPYVNGGLFNNKDASYKTPPINKDIYKHLMTAWEIGSKDKPFHWRYISPTNFGCIFESTLDPEKRDENGMHYTSPENIHRVIGPLFLDKLKEELENIIDLPFEGKEQRDLRIKRLQDYRENLVSMKFLDPACGSGNFLTETFKELRRLEMRVIEQLPNMGIPEDELKNDDKTMLDPCMVNINQFYGIEINDFAVSVARTALWISSCQMMKQVDEMMTKKSIQKLPLDKNTHIIKDNALTCAWEKPMEDSFISLTKKRKTKVDRMALGKVTNKKYYDYIIGNPPFLGSQRMNKIQKKELNAVLSAKVGSKCIWKAVGSMDYVCGWYAKAVEYMHKNKKTTAALVSTNSITQGEQVALLWEPLVTYYNLRISFARRTIKWENASDNEANVHFIVVGFYCQKADRRGDKYIYVGDEKGGPVKHINGYLLPAEDIFLHARLKHIQSKAPVMRLGSMPNDGEREARKQAKELAQKKGKAYNPSEIRGKLRLSKEEKESLTTQYPELTPYIRRIFGAEDFISGAENYCIWMREDEDDPLPSDIINHPALKDRFDFIREVRKNSTRPQTQVLQHTPYLFGEDRQPSSKYLLVPSTSSENRLYVPMGFVESNIICSNLALTIADCSLYHFGVLTSSLHMAWMKYVCGRLEMRFRYSASLVYNLFPWPNDVSEEQKSIIETAAQHILDVREQLGESYEKMYATNMNSKLIKAHLDNDAAVLKAYGFDVSWARDIENHETEIALELMRRSVKLAKSKEKKKRKKLVVKKVDKKPYKKHVMGNLPFVEKEVEQNTDD